MLIPMFILLVFTFGGHAQKGNNVTGFTGPSSNPYFVSNLLKVKEGKQNCRVVDNVLHHGQEWTHPQACIKFFCYDGDILEVSYCDQLMTDEKDCAIVHRPNLDYPYCCPKIICD
ncbi:hypothetical protein DMENIID0001_132850 [Sergentomyia squamirostris]